MKFKIKTLIGKVYRNGSGYQYTVTVPCPKGVDLAFTNHDVTVEFQDSTVGKAMRLFADMGLQYPDVID